MVRALQEPEREGYGMMEWRSTIKDVPVPNFPLKGYFPFSPDVNGASLGIGFFGLPKSSYFQYLKEKGKRGCYNIRRDLQIFNHLVLFPSGPRPEEMKLPEHVIMMIYRDEALSQGTRYFSRRNSGNSVRPVRKLGIKGS